MQWEGFEVGLGVLVMVESAAKRDMAELFSKQAPAWSSGSVEEGLQRASGVPQLQEKNRDCRQLYP